MAVEDDRIYHPTSALILPTPRRHFRVALHCEHWQLRSQIGACSDRYVYYVAGPNNSQVHRLDTQTHESETLKILSFQPRGLVVKNGWVSCGGEKGECVTFEIDESRDITDQPARPPSSSSEIPIHPLLRGDTGNDTNHARIVAAATARGWVPDPPRESREPAERALESAATRARRQVSMERARHRVLPRPQESESDDTDDDTDSMPALVNPSELLPTPPPEANVNNKNLVARSKCFGKERINCITLWFPPTSIVRPYRGSYAQPVAVLANNDRHVTVVELDSQDAINKITYPDFVNRALISPNGQLLVAICDDPYLYVHERVPKPGGGLGLFVRQDLTDFEWKPCAKIHLKSQRKDDSSDQRGSFAACFSATGTLLAVGTQYGTISVFNVAAFQESGSDPLITTFTTTRPNEDVGAVRDMAFCPGPFDLLAWTEHRGRVGVADIRTNYVSRQILDLNKYDDFEQIMVAEKGHIAASLLTRGDDGELTLNRTRVPGAIVSGGRGIMRGNVGPWPSREVIHPPLGADETMVLEALSAHRRRRDQQGDGRSDPRISIAPRGPSRTGTGAWPPNATNLLTESHELLFGEAPHPAADAAAGRLVRGPPTIRLRERSDDDVANSQLRESSNTTSRLRDTADRIRARRLVEQLQTIAPRAAANMPNSELQRTELQRTELQRTELQRTELQRTELQRTELQRTELQRTSDILSALRTLRHPESGADLTINQAQALLTDWENRTRPAATDSLAQFEQNAASARDQQYLASIWSSILRDRDGDVVGTAQVHTPASATTTGTAAAATIPVPVPRTTTIRTSTARAVRPGRVAERFNQAVMRNLASSRNDHEHDDTAGLAWSEDGRVLFVGADDGLYEFHVNMFSRSFIASVEMR